MQIQEWTALGGVVLGGGLTYLTQFSTTRQAAKNEDRRQASQRSELRRTEQLQLLREFIEIAQQGIRVAERRENVSDDAEVWEATGTPEWFASARDAVDRLFVTERMIQILFPPELYQRTWDYATAVDKVMWRTPDEIKAEGVMWQMLQEPQIAFLDAAHKAVNYPTRRSTLSDPVTESSTKSPDPSARR